MISKYEINQYSKTNMLHFLFNLLRIKGLYMFRALDWYCGYGATTPCAPSP
jgi:hypothetical protein